jgi:hypothetical protein
MSPILTKQYFSISIKESRGKKLFNIGSIGLIGYHVRTMAAVAQPRAFKFEFDHGGLLMEAASTLTVSPAKNIAYYFFPMLGAFLSGHQQLRPHDHLQSTLISEKAKQLAIRKVDELRTIAGIVRKIDVYTSDHYGCNSFGGTFSLMTPIVSVPRGLITKTGEPILHGAEPAEPIVEPAAHWTYTEDEVLFLMSREIVSLQSNSSIVRTAAKVFFVAAIYFFYTGIIPIFFSVLLIAAAITLHIIAERVVRAKFDVGAVEILGKYFKDKDRAYKAGKSTLEKLVAQNLERREQSSFYKLYITASGSNLLDLQHPPLDSRLKRLQETFSPIAAD